MEQRSLARILTFYHPYKSIYSILCCSPYFCPTDDSNQPQILTFGQRLCTNFLKVSYRQICNFIRALSPASSPFLSVVHIHMCGINTLYIPTLASGQMWSMTTSKVAHYLGWKYFGSDRDACLHGRMDVARQQRGWRYKGRPYHGGKGGAIHPDARLKKVRS